MKHIPYAITLLISSSLLFVVQPMVGKMVQPVLGGTPAVWNTAMVFFQALLLGGYLYAHLTTKWLGTRRQAVFHLVVLAIGLLFLPVGFEAPSDPASLESPAIWLLGTLLIGVGWPFFVVSTSAPLLQKWFSTIDHRDAADPYFLYAASNVGSVFALLAYPFLIEPRIGLHTQTVLWTVAYGILCASVAACAFILWKSPPPSDEPGPGEAPPASKTPLTWQRRGRWIIWAFIPSSMMLGVTTFITTDIAPMPLLWIPPLAVFLISFIIVFARRQFIPLNFWLILFPVFLVALATLYLTNSPGPLWFITLINFVGLFIFCMVFHGLLAADRPHTEFLTEFYLWMSFGGMLGGVFNALIAPLIFNQLLEYPTLLVVAALMFPVEAYRRKWVQRSLVLSLAAGLVFCLFPALRTLDVSTIGFSFLLACLVGFALAIVFTLFLQRWIPRVLAGLLLAVTIYQAQPAAHHLHVERSFFGTHVVIHYGEANVHGLLHGNTVHGLQFRDEGLSHLPASYHHSRGPIGQVFQRLGTRTERHPVAVAGLGSGALAAYAVPDQEFDFYEIDPVVKEIASTPEYFTYLSDCRGECSVILGDARLQLEAAPDERYELIIMDAYSSTAVPVHLLTREAVETYLQKLRPDGILAFQISNRFLDLEPPLTQIAEELGLESRVQHHNIATADPRWAFLGESSDWVIMARDRQALGTLAYDDRWLDLEPLEGMRTWTDDYANVMRFYRF